LDAADVETYASRSLLRLILTIASPQSQRRHA
jgi:hypothetical protein